MHIKTLSMLIAARLYEWLMTAGMWNRRQQQVYNSWDSNSSPTGRSSLEYIPLSRTRIA